MVAFDDSGYTRRDLIRGFLGLGAAAVTGGLANALNGCASDPIADSRFGEYSAKTLVSTTKHDRTSEVDYVRGLRVRKLLRSGDDGLSFVVYKLDVKDKDGKTKVVSPDKSAEILEASVLRGEDVSGRRLSSYPTLEGALGSVVTVENFYRTEQGWDELKTGTGTADIKKVWETKAGKLDDIKRRDARAPIAVIDTKNERVVGLYGVNDLFSFVEDTKLGVDDLPNLLNKDLYKDNERLREAVKQILRPRLDEEEFEEKMEEVGGTLAYLFDSDVEKLAVLTSATMFNKGEIEAHNLRDLFVEKDVQISWLKFDPESLAPIFPDKFKRSYALKLSTDKLGKVVADVMRKNGKRAS